MLVKIVTDGYKFIISTLSLAIMSSIWFWLGNFMPALYLAILFLILSIAITLFFRDPIRHVRRIYQDGNHIISPADGTVDLVEYTVRFQNREWDKISIFLSIFDVHVNRSPAKGVITEIEYCPGSFRSAIRKSSSQSNECKRIHINTITGHKVICVQIAGAIARRIVGFTNCVVGQELQAGERFGMIRFGSRTDLYLPAGKFKIQCKPGNRVKGGTSLLAEVITS